MAESGSSREEIEVLIQDEGTKPARIRSKAENSSRKPKASFHHVLNEAVRKKNRGLPNQDDQNESSSAPNHRYLWGVAARAHMMKDLDREDDDEDDDKDDFNEDFKELKPSFMTILECVILATLIVALICSLAIDKVKRKELWDIPLWKWESLLLALVSGHLISVCVIRVAVIFAEQTFLLQKRVLYFVYGLRFPAQNCLWLSLVLLVWKSIFHGEVDQPYVTKALLCLLVAAFLWLLKTLLVKVLASSFHVTNYFERIHDAIFQQYVIETLCARPSYEKRTTKGEEGIAAEVDPAKESRSTSARGLTETLLVKSRNAETHPSSEENGKKEKKTRAAHQPSRVNRKNVSPWYMMKMANILRHGRLSTLDEQILDSDMDGSLVHITSEQEAEKVAKKIFKNVAKPGSKVIHLEDLLEFMNEDETRKTIHLFGGRTENDGIDQRSLKSSVVKAFKEREALAKSLNDTNTAVDDLHSMLNIFVAIITIIVWLLILGVPVAQFLVFISSQLLLLAFVFGNSCKTVFEAMIFLFVTHPYHVGDRCEVDGVQMLVDEMNILTTVFLRHDNLKIRYPNSVLATKPISNYNRSPDMMEKIQFSLDVSTPREKIQKMKEKIIEFIDFRREHWYPNPHFFINDVEEMSKMTMTLVVGHRMNFQDMAERMVRRTLLIEHMISVFRDYQIECRVLPLDVNLRNLPVQSPNMFPSTWTS